MANTKEWHEKEEDRLRLMLEFVTEGNDYNVPDELDRELWDTLAPEIRQIRDDARPWMYDRNVQGFGIVDKNDGASANEELALCVYVEKRIPRSKVANPVPPKVGFSKLTAANAPHHKDVPEKFGELATDVVEVGTAEAQANARRLRPARPGCGISPAEGATGTLGCLVRSLNDSSLYILSNAHVLADLGFAKTGDDIIQPGYPDGGRISPDAIAQLENWVQFRYPDRDNKYPNLVDAAIARVRQNNAVEPHIPKSGDNSRAAPPTGFSTHLRRGMKVKKFGYASDFTRGVIKDTCVKGFFYLSRSNGELHRIAFREQVRCSKFTYPGDSGSVVLNRSHNVVGLHFAGSEKWSWFNPINKVFEELQIRLA
jgi:hypothetical protein